MSEPHAEESIQRARSWPEHPDNAPVRGRQEFTVEGVSSRDAFVTERQGSGVLGNTFALYLALATR